MRILTRVLLYDVVLAMVYIMVDGYLIYSYFNTGDSWWAAATITAVCLPGLLGELIRIDKLPRVFCMHNGLSI